MTARSIAAPIGAALVLAAGMLLAACQRDTSDGPTELSGHLFVFNYRVASATYMITLKKTAPIAEGTVAVAAFENPMGGDPLVLRQKIFPFWDKITLESPEVHCVRKDRPYGVTITLVDAGGKTIQTIATKVTSSFDQSILPAKPLVVGPVYTPNPEVFKADGSVDFSPEPACPAA